MKFLKFLLVVWGVGLLLVANTHALECQELPFLKPRINKCLLFDEDGSKFISEAKRVLRREVKESGTEGLDQFMPVHSLIYYYHLKYEASKDLHRFIASVPTQKWQDIIFGLKEIGDDTMAGILSEVINVYRSQKYLFGEKNLPSYEWQTYLIRKFPSLEKLPAKFESQKDSTVALLRQYLRTHPSNYFLDENGLPFVLQFTGTCTMYGEDGLKTREVDLKDGMVHGSIRSYGKEGRLQSVKHFTEGDETGLQEKYHRNGLLQLKEYSGEIDGFVVQEYFYNNGNPFKYECRNKNAKYGRKQVGQYKEWYENGQLSVDGFFTDKSQKDGDWLEYFDSGKEKMRAKYTNGKVSMMNFWMDEETQTVKNGNGSYEVAVRGGVAGNNRNVEYFEDGILYKHQKFSDQVLLEETLYEEDGAKRTNRYFYNNGKLKRSWISEDGKSHSFENYPKFDKPVVINSVTDSVCYTCMKDETIHPDNVPKGLLNGETLITKVDVPITSFKEFDIDRGLKYMIRVTVGKEGGAAAAKVTSSCPIKIKHQIESLVSEMKFDPGLKNGQPIEYITIVEMKFELGDGG